jgi:hypothetical protein
MLPLECDEHVSGVLVELVSQALDGEASDAQAS